MSEAEMDFACEPTTPVEPMRSSSIAKLAEALAKAQLKFKPIKKQVENTFYTTEKKKAMYADLAAIIEATQPALASEGLVVIQTPIINHAGKSAGVESLLVHSSGEWIRNECVLPATERRKEYGTKQGEYTWKEQFTAQTCGIGMTYARRYSYQSIIGVAAEEDDDGNRISGAVGSTEAAQDVGASKVAAIKQRIAETASAKDMNQETASAPQNGSGEVYGLLKAAKKIKLKNGKGDALALEVLDPQDKSIAVFCFDNRQYPDGTHLFDLLEMAAEGHGQSVRLKVKASGKFTNVDRPLAIGSVTFDGDGVPEIQRDADSVSA